MTVGPACIHFGQHASTRSVAVHIGLCLSNMQTIRVGLMYFSPPYHTAPSLGATTIASSSVHIGALQTDSPECATCQYRRRIMAVKIQNALPPKNGCTPSPLPRKLDCTLRSRRYVDMESRSQALTVCLLAREGFNSPVYFKCPMLCSSISGIREDMWFL
jgi:hypothetical protein